MKKSVKAILLILLTTALLIAASCAAKEEKFHNELKHPTRAHEMGPEEECYVGESVRTDNLSIRFISSGTNYGTDPAKQKSDDSKQIYMEFEYRSLNETEPKLSSDNFSLIINDGDMMICSASSMEDTVKVNRKKVYFEVPKNTNSAEIVFMETGVDQHRYLFLWEGSYSISVEEDQTGSKAN